MSNLEELKKYINESDITYELSDEFKFLVIFDEYVIFDPSNHGLMYWIDFTFYILYNTLSESEKNELLQYMKKIANHQ